MDTPVPPLDTCTFAPFVDDRHLPRPARLELIADLLAAVVEQTRRAAFADGSVERASWDAQIKAHMTAVEASYWAEHFTDHLIDEVKLL